ncbi:hypothetical protein DSO57_1000290 [Entomophthora muscae]|uniref:Uncharacterized protein n=1 Tax=Entomophthora muscae TaxID=34485 RepID=A0ACC2SYE3_9FUNG|nr:hypothetical protein DSO57_1000290 [Entomophthora muscae]
MLASLKERFGGNDTGDTLQMGGTFVINTDARVLYSHLQENMADLTDVNEVFKVCHDEFMTRMLTMVSNPPKNTAHYKPTRRKSVVDIPLSGSFLIYRLPEYTCDTASSPKPIPWDMRDEVF